MAARCFGRTSAARPVPRPAARQEDGADTVTRTRDLLITNQLLYQLSYVGAQSRRGIIGERSPLAKSALRRGSPHPNDHIDPRRLAARGKRRQACENQIARLDVAQLAGIEVMEVEMVRGVAVEHRPVGIDSQRPHQPPIGEQVQGVVDRRLRYPGARGAHQPEHGVRRKVLVPGEQNPPDEQSLGSAADTQTIESGSDERFRGQWDGALHFADDRRGIDGLPLASGCFRGNTSEMAASMAFLPTENRFPEASHGTAHLMDIQDRRRNPCNRAIRAARGTLPAAPGFTLVEWLGTLAIIALLAGLGAPALRDWATRLRVEAALAPLARGLALARAEAMATGRAVTFTPRELPVGLRWSGSPPSISFGAAGGATPSTLTVCGPGPRGRSLVVSRTGRIRASDATCGFALPEVLVALVLLASATLATVQAQLLATGFAGTQIAYRQALDAATAASEPLRLVQGDAAMWNTRVAPVWREAFASATSGMVLEAQPLDAIAGTPPAGWPSTWSGGWPGGWPGGWQVTAQLGTVRITLAPYVAAAATP